MSPSSASPSAPQHRGTGTPTAVSTGVKSSLSHEAQ